MCSGPNDFADTVVRRQVWIALARCTRTLESGRISNYLDEGRTEQTLKSGTPLPTISNLDASSGFNNAAPDDAQHFFKVAWPEICRDNGPHILRVALDRAAKHLPIEHQEAVTGHLPNIVQFQEVEGTSTAIIRRLLGLPTTDSRVQLWTVSKKLSGLETLLDPTEFWKAFWEIIRCMSDFTVCLLLSTDSIMIRPSPIMAHWHCSWGHQSEYLHA